MDLTQLSDEDLLNLKQKKSILNSTMQQQTQGQDNPIMAALDYALNNKYSQQPIEQASDQIIQNQQPTKLQNVLNNVQSFKNDVMDGYSSGATASGAQKLGRGLDIARGIMSNPAVQGILAGTLYGIDKNDALYGLKQGFDWAQNKAKSDYYAGQIGAKPGILGGYNKDDLNARVNSIYRDRLLDLGILKAGIDKDYKEGRVKNETTKVETDKKYKEGKLSNETKKTNGQLNRWSHQNTTDSQKVAISQQNANQKGKRQNSGKINPAYKVENDILKAQEKAEVEAIETDPTVGVNRSKKIAAVRAKYDKKRQALASNYIGSLSSSITSNTSGSAPNVSGGGKLKLVRVRNK